MVDATAPHRLRGATDVMPVAPSPHVATTPRGEIRGYAQLPHLRGGELPRLSSSRKRRCARTTSDNKTCPTEPPTPPCATQQPPLFPLRCKHRHCRNAANLFITTRYLRSCAGIGNRKMRANGTPLVSSLRHDRHSVTGELPRLSSSATLRHHRTTDTPRDG